MTVKLDKCKLLFIAEHTSVLQSALTAQLVIQARKQKLTVTTVQVMIIQNN